MKKSRHEVILTSLACAVANGTSTPAGAHSTESAAPVDIVAVVEHCSHITHIVHLHARVVVSEVVVVPHPQSLSVSTRSRSRALVIGRMASGRLRMPVGHTIRA